MTAYERPNRGNTVWLRWGWGGGAPKQRATTLKLRDDAGQVLAAREADALAMLALAAAALARGEDPGDALHPAAAPAQIGEMRLRQGFDRALEIESGRGHYTTKTEHWKQAVVYSDDLCEILGADTLWRTVTEDTAAQVWRKYAGWHAVGATRKVRQGDGWQIYPKGGHDAARRSVWWLYVVAKRVARAEQRVAPDPPRDMRGNLADIWVKMTGKTTDPACARFTDDEVAALLARLPAADPRLRLALGLALESRLGQVIRGMRSHLDIRPGAGALGHGILTIHGQRKKRGTFIDLTVGQRADVDAAMAKGGMLAKLEIDYLAIGKDYPLFPGGRVPLNGEVRHTATTSWTPTGLRCAMLDLQIAAGVAIIAGRGVYGLRRWAADRAEDFETDERALNVITSHAHTRTRRGYQDSTSTSARKLAADVREKLRAQPVKTPQTGPEPTPEPTPDFR